MKKFIIVALWKMIILASTEGNEFGYSKSAQLAWSEEFPQCGGTMQSPIVIAASRSVALPLPALEMVGYHDFLVPPLVLSNNGHTVSLRVRHEFSKKRFPYIFGAILNEDQDYELESFHFHWGAKNSRGSEHVLHGTRYPMEMHLIHRNMKYENLETAIQNEDGLAVLGIFFHVSINELIKNQPFRNLTQFNSTITLTVGAILNYSSASEMNNEKMEEEDNELLRPLMTHLLQIQSVHSEIQLNTSIILASLLPQDLDTYYTYKGSLTTPPCNEVVTWIMFASSVPISFKQMNKFRLVSDGKSVLADNFRILQEIGNRKVYVRRTHNVFVTRNEIDNLDVSGLDWTWQ